MIRQSLLIDLDSLVDTRLGTLWFNYPATFKALDLDAYDARTSTHIWETFGLSEEQWLDAWESRDVRIFQMTKPTTLYHTLAYITGSRAVQGAVSPVHDKLRVYINVYPYNLSKQAGDEIVAIVSDQLVDDVKVELVYHPMEDLTPKMIAATYDSVVMYEFHKWMVMHGVELGQRPMPKVTVYFPGLVAEPNEDVDRAVVECGNDPYEDLQYVMSSCLTVKPLASELFTIHRKEVHLEDQHPDEPS